MKAWRGVIEQYRDFLPVTDRTPVVTLCEGNTPLILAPRLAEATDARLEIYLKCEGFNPTGSFKDRGMTMAISKALESGSRAVICASTGNTSASAAAFAARAGIRAFVMVPKGSVALGKLSQAAIHGAKVLTVDGNFDQALTIVRRIAERHPVTLVNSVNPFRLEGQKTAAFEIVDQLGRAPDYHLIPVGNAGNITAYWRGYREYHRAGRMKELPRMVGFQAAGAAPIYENRVIVEPRTVATAIKIGNPANWGPAPEAMKDSRSWASEPAEDPRRRCDQRRSDRLPPLERGPGRAPAPARGDPLGLGRGRDRPHAARPLGARPALALPVPSALGPARAGPRGHDRLHGEQRASAARGRGRARVRRRTTLERGGCRRHGPGLLDGARDAHRRARARQPRRRPDARGVGPRRPGADLPPGGRARRAPDRPRRDRRPHRADRRARALRPAHRAALRALAAAPAARPRRLRDVRPRARRDPSALPRAPDPLVERDRLGPPGVRGVDDARGHEPESALDRRLDGARLRRPGRLDPVGAGLRRRLPRRRGARRRPLRRRAGGGRRLRARLPREPIPADRRAGLALPPARAGEPWRGHARPAGRVIVIDF